ncbi:hypothetical protein [Methylobacterium iners]|uniref:Uncharacterized protein n=1 Tax=Methylobacterium iners TaxID=418707 RepID=A0ABQ4RS08_9HYPH|nr:hypothetical protein [Methylobacterium iners]GJD93130.1 hypothetical protein OCOJLMKI_0320 [Methylobacterium iners]
MIREFVTLSDQQNNLSSPPLPIQAEAARLLTQGCFCRACEPFHEQRTKQIDPDFADLVVSGREEMARADARQAAELEATSVQARHLPRVMDLPSGLARDELQARLAYAGFHPSCPQYRALVTLLADSSFYSAVAQSRIGKFDHTEAARSAPRKQSTKRARQPRHVPPVCSLIPPENLVIPPEQIAAERARVKRMAYPDHVGAARKAAQQRVGEQIAAAMLGTDEQKADEA